jgi:hypothetical protein
MQGSCNYRIQLLNQRCKSGWNVEIWIIIIKGKIASEVGLWLAREAIDWMCIDNYPKK